MTMPCSPTDCNVTQPPPIPLLQCHAALLMALLQCHAAPGACAMQPLPTTMHNRGATQPPLCFCNARLEWIQTRERWENKALECIGAQSTGPCVLHCSVPWGHAHVTCYRRTLNLAEHMAGPLHTLHMPIHCSCLPLMGECSHSKT